jgi:hypothetical protein
VPLIDASGSTIALVNAASTPSPAATTYTYDPSGSATLNGQANNWPFLYQGVEKEFTDPGPLYCSGGGQFYSSQLVRSLSETGQTSTSGPATGPSGSGGGGSGRGSSGGASRSGLSPFGDIASSADCPNGDCGSGQQNSTQINVSGNDFVKFFEDIGQFFQNLFGLGGSTPLRASCFTAATRCIRSFWASRMV